MAEGRKINTETEILGLIGYPLEHTFSPYLHNYALDKLDLNYVYLTFEIRPENLQEGIKGLKSLGIRGVNVTIPYKEKVLSFLDEVDSLADEIGAVNTIINKDENLKGFNTDALGFKRMLEEDGDFEINNKKVLIIGAGGASRAVGSVLCRNGIKELYLINRTRKKAEELGHIWQKNYPHVKIETGILAPEYYNLLLKRVDLVVDTTPVGMSPEIDVPPVISTEKFHSNLLVVDLVYNPAVTTILDAARKAGAKTLNGQGMLLYQGIEAFELWTGVDPDNIEWPGDIFKI